MRYTIRRAIFHYRSKERGVSNVWIHDQIQNLGYVYFLESIKEKKILKEMIFLYLIVLKKISIYIYIIKIS